MLNNHYERSRSKSSEQTLATQVMLHLLGDLLWLKSNYCIWNKDSKCFHYIRKYTASYFSKSQKVTVGYTVLYWISFVGVWVQGSWWTRMCSKPEEVTRIPLCYVWEWVAERSWRKRQREKKRKKRGDCVVLWWKAWLIREWWLQ